MGLGSSDPTGEHADVGAVKRAIGDKLDLELRLDGTGDPSPTPTDARSSSSQIPPSIRTRATTATLSARGQNGRRAVGSAAAAFI